MRRGISLAIVAVLAAGSAGACGSPIATPTAVPLSATARSWCLEHDQGTPGFGETPDTFDEITVAAIRLGLPVPRPVRDMDAALRAASASGGQVHIAHSIYVAYAAFASGDGMTMWRASPEYARACLAAYGSR